MRYTLLAACMMHVEGYFDTRNLAFRNHNPGNIEKSPGVYHIYGSAFEGYVALVLDIEANHGKSLRSFIAKYAPPNENNTSTYLEVVSTLSGIGPDEFI